MAEEEMNDHRPLAHAFRELDPAVQKLLTQLEDDEVDSLRYLATIPRDELRGMMKMFRDVKAVSTFMRWLIIAFVSIFVGTVALGESAMKAWGWFRGSP